MKRTTVILSDQDQEALSNISDKLQCSEMEAIRRSLRLANTLVGSIHAGAELIIVSKEGTAQTILFV